eukprot:151997-Rhodomonas_salina.1
MLLAGQKKWRQDGGVVPLSNQRSAGMVAVWDVVLSARSRRPDRRMEWGEDPRPLVGSFWDLDAFRKLPDALYLSLEEMKALEDEQTLYFQEHGTYSGDLIRPDGAIELWLGPEVRDEWRDGI